EALPGHTRYGAYTMTIVAANLLLILCIKNRVSKAKSITYGILSWMKVLYCVSIGMLDDVNYLLVISTSRRTRMQGKERPCKYADQEEKSCRENKRLLHRFISFE